MGIIADVMEALDRIPAWKRVKALPEEVDALRARIEALERKASGAALATCPMCGSERFARTRTDNALADIGYITDHFRCQDCGHQEPRQRDVLQQ